MDEWEEENRKGELQKYMNCRLDSQVNDPSSPISMHALPQQRVTIRSSSIATENSKSLLKTSNHSLDITSHKV